MFSLELLNQSLAKYEQNKNVLFNYSVSGMRSKGILLDLPVFKAALIACLRSMSLNGTAIGFMITASHNPAEDNGIKIIDPKGEMLNKDWIKLAAEFVNLPNEQVKKWLITKIKELNITCFDSFLIIGKDTRLSSEKLATIATKAVLSVKGDFIDFGLVTTPQLHYIVHSYNSNGAYGEPSEEGYYKKLSNSFNELTQNLETDSYEKTLTIDCANGVGYAKMDLMTKHLNKDLVINLKNIGDGVLNFNCGADFVKIEQKSPIGIDLSKGIKFASFDGDADRLIYFCVNPETKSFRIIDGDKISVLFAIYINKILKKLNLEDKLDISIIQTAYANGNSTKYIEKVLKMKTFCVATGVLNLHHKALEFDIGIYFEANGHGTILFKNKVVELLQELALKENKDAKEFLLFIDLINQTAGDAISDLLAVEFILKKLNFSINQFADIYEDLPQKQVKVIVKNKSLIKITDDEKKCLEPKSLQDEIDILVKSYGENSRSFVRPSQTEDIVRVYAESDTFSKATELANKVTDKVKSILS